ncbi:hypothetical protein LPJ81_003923 [Coemansia sp. IMI 209127]|nr:hypothetical protein LPJ81_003923 [Coemansia sp. IMI 209127]
MLQLTKELLSTFIEDATTRAQQTLSNNDSLTPFVFANSALLWLIPTSVNHPLRRAVGLSTPFILITGLTEASKKEHIVLRHVQNIACGADPLETWRCLSLQSDDNVQRGSKYSHDWGCQKQQPLERNKARMLTAQYAQILPQLSFTEGGSEKLAMPMLVLTRDVDAVASPKCFHLTVFPPSSSSAFANVIAIRKADALQGSGVIEVLEQNKGDRVRMQCWAEYDLLGSPISSESPLDESFQESALPVPDNTDDVSMHSASEENSTYFGCLQDVSPPAPSYVTLHGVWTSESTIVSGGVGSCKIELPPLPPPATQWILELVSMPMAQEPEASRSLWALRMEIKRLDAWCHSWINSTKWIEGEARPFTSHAWQSSSSSSRKQAHSTDGEKQKTLEEHREIFGKKIDEFMDTSIYDTSGSTALGRLGRTRDIHALAGFPVREDLDFTERLWNLSHDAHDDSDLSEIVAAVAEGLETRKLQPYIHQSNKTRLGRLIRDALQVAHLKTLADDDAEKERLARQLDEWIDERPLDAFVHVGVHKLRADFWFYFVGGHLATPRQLEPFVDAEIEPERLVPRLWLLLRVLEVWWLVQQAVPAMPQQFVRQTVGAILSHFAAYLEAIDRDVQQQSNNDAGSQMEEGTATGLATSYLDPVKLTLYLPMYSTDVQEFATSIADGFPPARFIVAASSGLLPDTEEGSADTIVLAPKHRMVYFTKTPALIDMHFAGDEDMEEEIVNGSGQDSEEYAVFEAKLF